MKRTIFWLSVALVVFMSANILYSQRSRANKQVIVELSGNGFVRGWIVTNRKGQRVIIDLDGQTTELTDKDKVHSIAELEKEFRKKERDIKIKGQDKTREYLKLLEWAKEHQLYEAAYKLSRKLVRRNPANPDANAREIFEWAQKYYKLARTAKPPKSQQWSKDDVQKIRFALLPVDRPVQGIRISFRHNLLKRFIAEMKSEGVFTTEDQVRKFSNASRIIQAQFIKRQTGNKYQADIFINSDPPAMLAFRKTIAPILNRTCANIRCHGGGASDFRLIPNMKNTVDMYANFYLLDSYKCEQGEVINHQQPEASLFLQYLLPPSQVKEGFRHPVPFRTPIKSKSDMKYKRILDWIKSLPKDKIDVLLGENQQQDKSANEQTDKADKQ